MNQAKPLNETEAGDQFFAGCDQRNALLCPPGVLNDGANLRFTNGLAETRKGVAKPAWANQVLAGQVIPFGTPYGAGAFRDPNGREWGIIAADGYAFRIIPHNAVMTLPLPTGVKLLTETAFVQAFDKVFAFRGRFLAPLRMSDLDTGFEDIIDHYNSGETYAADAEVATGPWLNILSITRSAGVATVETLTDHGYVTGSDVTIRGLDQSEYNGRVNVTVTSSTTFTFVVAGSPATPATGGSESAITLTSVTRSGVTATATKNAHGLDEGSTVFIAGANEAAYNGTFVISNVAANTFDYTMASDPGGSATGSVTATLQTMECSNMGQYWKALGTLATVSGITLASTTATVTTDAAHNFVSGQTVTIAGCVQTEYNGTFIISNASGSTFDYTVTGTPDSPATTLTAITARNAIVLAGNSPQTTPADWTRAYNILPNAQTALYTNNRLLVATAYEPSSVDNYATLNGGTYKKVDYIVATDFLDELHFTFANEFRINQGSQDEIVDLAKFVEDTVVVFKGSSWGILSGVAALDTGSLALDFREMGYGLAARGAHVKVGSDLYFHAGSRGIVSIRQSENGKLMSVDVPLSAPIARTLARISGNQTPRIRLDSWQNKLYCACALDDSATNNTVLVYDFVTAERVRSPLDESNRLGWTPLDDGAGGTVAEWFKLELNGEQRLFSLGTDGFVNLHEEREDGDDVADLTLDQGLGLEPISARALTRGYYGDTGLAFQRPLSITVSLRTWDPTYSVTAVFEGVGKELALVTGETRDRTKYFRPFNAALYDATNVNDDHATPYREDYSVPLPAGGVYFGTAGMDLNLVQSVTESHNIAGRQGRYFQLEITNTTGRLQLCGVKLTAVPAKFRRGQHT